VSYLIAAPLEQERPFEKVASRVSARNKMQGCSSTRMLYESKKCNV